MRKISNSEENNQYYKLVNQYIDEYMEHNVRPSNLKKYFKNASKLETFLKKYELSDVDGIKRIVHDVLEDRWAAEKDGVMKFEKFILNEDLGNIKLKEADVNYEKVLADLYHSSVGHVEVVDKSEHKYKVTDFGKEIEVVIYSKEDIEDFKKSLLPILTQEANDEVVYLHGVELGLKSRKEVKCKVSIPIKDIVSEEKLNSFLSELLKEKKLLDIITDFINDFDILKSGKNYTYSTTYNGAHIWELSSKGEISRVKS
jgi:hypothetical protein